MAMLLAAARVRLISSRYRVWPKWRSRCRRNATCRHARARTTRYAEARGVGRHGGDHRIDRLPNGSASTVAGDAAPAPGGGVLAAMIGDDAGD
jgi:hypothetical protein